jgi:hypothetical protein
MSVRMRTLMVCVAGGLLVAASLLSVAYALTHHSVQAIISSQCVPEPGVIVVPAGSIAKNFKCTTLEHGNSCETAALIREKSFKLGEFYYIDREGKISQGPGRLATLTLGPGTYRLTVSGGRFARVVLEYDTQP